MTLEYHIPQRPGTQPLGGKADNLIKLVNAGVNVPSFLVLRHDFLLALHSMDSRGAWNHSWTEEITRLLGSTTLAVRSSAIGEDGLQHSFAGQFDSILNVDPSDLPNAVERVWNSRRSQRVDAYRSDKGLEAETPMCVIIQAMVDANFSGVAFSANPVTGNRRQCVINLIHGLGDSLVSGETSGQQFVLDEKSTVLEFTGTEVWPTPMISDELLKRVHETVRGMEAAFGCPQDMEFALRDGILFVLQSRPITHLPEPAVRIIWDNSNIVESFPGLTQPLTFSFILRVYDRAYRQLLALLGAPSSSIEQHGDVFANTLGLIHGRVYYNLYAWYKMLSLLPGYHLNKGFMEKMMGVKESFDLQDHSPMGGLKAWFFLGRSILRILWSFVTLSAMRRRFQINFQSELNRLDQLQLSALNPAQLVEVYRDFERRIIGEWKAPLVNDFFTMIFFGIMQKQLEKHGLQSLQNDLLIGSQDIISVEPARRIARLIEEIKADPSLEALFRSDETDADVLAHLSEAHPGFHASFRQYILDFGNRCGEELKWETRTYEVEPERLIAYLSSLLRSGVSSTFHTEEALAQRMESEGKVRSALGNRWTTSFLIRKTRELVSNRENLRYERTRAFAIGRRIFREIGRQWHNEGKVKALEDIFHLPLETIFALAENPKTADWSAVQQEIAESQSKYTTFAEERLPDRIESIDGEFMIPTIHTSDGRDAWQGIGCCPGLVRAEVVRVVSPMDSGDLNGKILLARSTDPGWVPLFAAAKALLVERGSMLSHSAIVSREMGIPCVVNIPGIFDDLQTGDVVEMDGRTGRVQCIERNDR